MEKLVIRNSRWKFTAFSVLSLALCVFFSIIFTEVTGAAKYIVLTMAILFGLSSIFMFRNAMNQNPKIVIDDEGIWADTFPESNKKIPYREIESLQVVEARVIAIKLRNEDELLSEIELSKYHRWFPHLTFRLFFNLTDAGTREALAVIVRNLEQNRDLQIENDNRH